LQISEIDFRRLLTDRYYSVVSLTSSESFMRICVYTYYISKEQYNLDDNDRCNTILSCSRIRSPLLVSVRNTRLWLSVYKGVITHFNRYFWKYFEYIFRIFVPFNWGCIKSENFYLSLRIDIFDIYNNYLKWN